MPQTENLHREICWIPADEILPMGPHEVLATDGEGCFIAEWDGAEWFRDAEPVDSVVTHWAELPEIPMV